MAAVKSIGGQAVYDFEDPRGANRPLGLPRWKRVIADAIGIDFVSSITSVDLDAIGSESDRERILACLGDFENLESAYLKGTWVTDDVLARLRATRKLQVLVLEFTAVTDAGLANLEGFTGLLAGCIAQWHHRGWPCAPERADQSRIPRHLPVRR